MSETAKKVFVKLVVKADRFCTKREVLLEL